MTRLPSALFFPVVVKHSGIHHQGGVDANKVSDLSLTNSTNAIVIDIPCRVKTQFLALISHQAWYLIDPASNLEGTRERMKSWVEKTFRHWNGVIGKEPDAVHALKQVRTQVSV